MPGPAPGEMEAGRSVGEECIGRKLDPHKVFRLPEPLTFIIADPSLEFEQREPFPQGIGWPSLNLDTTSFDLISPVNPGPRFTLG